MQLLSGGRGGAQKPAEVPALDEFEETAADNERRGSPPSLLVQVKRVELLGCRNELGKGKESEVVSVAKAPRLAGGDVELRARGPSFGQGRKMSRLREGVVPAPKEDAGSAVARQEGTLVVELWVRSQTSSVSTSHVGDVTLQCFNNDGSSSCVAPGSVQTTGVPLPITSVPRCPFRVRILS